MEILKSKNTIKILKSLGYRVVGKKVVVDPIDRMTITGIMKKTRVSLSTVSRIIGMLERDGYVKKEKVSTTVYVELSDNFADIFPDLGEIIANNELNRATNKGKNRQVVINFLKKFPDTKVCDIAPELTRVVVSQELRVLREAGIVKFRKDGKFRRYWIPENT